MQDHQKRKIILIALNREQPIVFMWHKTLFKNIQYKIKLKMKIIGVIFTLVVHLCHLPSCISSTGRDA